MQRTVAEVLVGSRLHGLATPDSDHDYRRIVRSPLIEMLSPFRPQKTKGTQDDGQDTVEFELAHFVKHLVQGNPTMLEILWSDQTAAITPIWAKLRAHRHHVLDSERIYFAHRGYAGNQRRRMEADRIEGKFNSPIRRGKFAAAAIRTLLQGKDLLAHGDFTPDLTVSEPDLAEMLKTAKAGLSWGTVTNTYLPLIRVHEYEFDRVYASHLDRFSPDIPWLEGYLLESYLSR